MGYWTTDFLVVQRILAAKDIRSARDGSIIGAGLKMLVPIIVILPGLLGLAVLPMKLTGESTAAAMGPHSYNDVLPLMLARYCGPGLLGLGITALIAGFMSGMAGNVSAFTTVWTYDIYRPFINSKGSDKPLPQHGPLDDRHRRSYQHRHRLSRDAVRQHHGLRPSPIQFLHRATIRHRRSRNVVEARNRSRWILGLPLGTVSSISMWAWVKIDPSALRYVALSPNAKALAQDMYQALWSFASASSSRLSSAT